MAKAPKEHYISWSQKEVVLVWSFPNLLTKKTLLFAFGVGLFFAFLLVLESNNFPRSALIGASIAIAIIAWSFLKQQFFNSDNMRIALAMNTRELGTRGFMWAYTIPWSKVKKIHCNSAVSITLPVSHFDFWIYPTDKAQRFISIPKLTVEEYQEFFEILKWHTKRNNVELVVL